MRSNAIAEVQVGIGPREALVNDPQHQLLELASAVEHALGEEQRGVRDLVVVPVRVDVVAAREAGVEVHNRSVGVERLPGGPRQLDYGEQHRLPTRKSAADRLVAHLRPEALGGAVEHDQVVVEQEPRDAEVVDLPVQRGVEDDATPRERTVARNDRNASDHVVDDLVPPQDVVGVGPRLSIDDDSEDERRGLQEGVTLRCGDGGGLCQRRDAVLARSSGDDLVLWDETRLGRRR